MGIEIESNVIEWVIMINGPEGQMIVGVHPDGSVEYGPDFTAQTAAKAFWEAVGEQCLAGLSRFRVLDSSQERS